MTDKIDIEACRERQNRLRSVMRNQQLDWIVLSSIESVQWLTGVRFTWFFESTAAMDADGRVFLIAPHREPEASAAEFVATYDAKWHSTLRNDQKQAAGQRLLELLREHQQDQSLKTGRVGCEFDSVGGSFLNGLTGSCVGIDSDLYRLRRKKERDELARIQRAIDATGRMYEAARKIIRPGVTEIEVFNTLQSAAVVELGEMLTGTGNDYQCGSRGGPPRNQRPAAAGELYILDLGPAYQGYFADNARTIAVSDVSDAQQRAWEAIMEAFELVESMVRPGVSCREVFEAVQNRLDQAPLGVFNHHLGHGIGLFPHEAPHLNPHWDDCFEVGDVFTAEPGLYAPELSIGMRIENDYRVTSDGIELLTHFPLELKC